MTTSNNLEPTTSTSESSGRTRNRPWATPVLLGEDGSRNRHLGSIAARSRAGNVHECGPGLGRRGGFPAGTSPKSAWAASWRKRGEIRVDAEDPAGRVVDDDRAGGIGRAMRRLRRRSRWASAGAPFSGLLRHVPGNQRSPRRSGASWGRLGLPRWVSASRSGSRRRDDPRIGALSTFVGREQDAHKREEREEGDGTGDQHVVFLQMSRTTRRERDCQRSLLVHPVLCEV